MPASVRDAIAGALCVLAWLASQPAAAADCATELAALTQSEAELPQLDLTPPIHRRLVCITLETLVEFAQRVDTHVGRCPFSAYAEKVVTWGKARNDYAARFHQRRCRRSL